MSKGLLLPQVFNVHLLSLPFFLILSHRRGVWSPLTAQTGQATLWTHRLATAQAETPSPDYFFQCAADPNTWWAQARPKPLNWLHWVQQGRAWVRGQVPGCPRPPRRNTVFPHISWPVPGSSRRHFCAGHRLSGTALAAERLYKEMLFYSRKMLIKELC